MSRLAPRMLRVLDKIGALEAHEEEDCIDWDLFVDVARWDCCRWSKLCRGGEHIPVGDGETYRVAVAGDALPPEWALTHIKGVGPYTRDVIVAAAWREVWSRFWP